MSDDKARWENIEDAARDAYEAYRKHDHLTLEWSALPHATKAGWCAAVRRTLTKAYRIVANDLIDGIREDVKRHEKLMDSEGN